MFLLYPFEPIKIAYNYFLILIRTILIDENYPTTAQGRESRPLGLYHS